MDIIWDDDVYSDAVMILLQDDDSDDTQQEEEDGITAQQEQELAHVCGRRSGSSVGKRPNIERNRVLYSHLLYKDFWGESPVYDKTYFKRFFKLPIELFDDIVHALVVHDD